MHVETINLFNTLTPQQIAFLISNVVQSYSSEPPLLVSVSSEFPDISPNDLQSLFSATSIMVKGLLREQLKKEALYNNLVSLKLSEQSAKAVLQSLSSNKAIVRQLSSNVPTKAFLVDVDWRVDVSLSSASAATVLRPFILCNMTLSDSTNLNFEMTVEEFMSFRFTITSALSAITNLDK
ncbi:hypothetical protein RCL1_003822 [Eukaryota sp. TZLM3-RCL]